jgi:hypothetical protein
MDDVRRTPSHGVRIEDLVEQVHPPLDHPSALVANTARTASADEVGSGVVIGWVSARCQTPGQAGPGRPPQLARKVSACSVSEPGSAVSGGDEPYAVQAFRAHGAGAAGSGPAGLRRPQPRDRATAGPVREDRPQPHVSAVDEVAGARPHRRRDQGSRRRPRTPLKPGSPPCPDSAPSRRPSWSPIPDRDGKSSRTGRDP